MLNIDMLHLTICAKIKSKIHPDIKCINPALYVTILLGYNYTTSRWSFWIITHLSADLTVSIYLKQRKIEAASFHKH